MLELQRGHRIHFVVLDPVRCNARGGQFCTRAAAPRGDGGPVANRCREAICQRGKRRPVVSDLRVILPQYRQA